MLELPRSVLILAVWPRTTAASEWTAVGCSLVGRQEDRWKVQRVHEHAGRVHEGP